VRSSVASHSGRGRTGAVVDYDRVVLGGPIATSISRARAFGLGGPGGLRPSSGANLVRQDVQSRLGFVNVARPSCRGSALGSRDEVRRSSSPALDAPSMIAASPNCRVRDRASSVAPISGLDSARGEVGCDQRFLAGATLSAIRPWNDSAFLPCRPGAGAGKRPSPFLSRSGRFSVMCGPARSNVRHVRA